MNDEIMKMVEKVSDPDKVPAFENGFFTLTPREMHAFYNETVNIGFSAGIEAAAKVCDSQEDFEYATGKVDHNERSWCSHLAQAIRALEKK